MHNPNVGHRRLMPVRCARYLIKLKERPLPDEEQMVINDKNALEYLRGILWPEGEMFCPRCGEKRIYTLSGGRYRCSNCKYTFTELSGRWINTGGMAYTDWIYLARLFVEDFSAQAMSEEMGLSYNTVYKGLTAIRFALLAQALDAPALFGHETGLSGYIRNRRLVSLPKKSASDVFPVFGILEKYGWAFVDLIPNFQAETVFHFGLNFQLPLKKCGNIVYTDRYRHYDALLFCGDESLPMRTIRPTRQSTALDRTECGFWTYARHRLKNFKGISPARFPLYLKEIEFRYNHRDQDLMPLVLKALCDLVPDFGDQDS